MRTHPKEPRKGMEHTTSERLVTEPNTHCRYHGSKENACHHFESRMPNIFCKLFEVLYTVEELALLFEHTPCDHGIVPDETRKTERNGKLRGLYTQLSPHHNKQRGNKSRVCARHPPGMEELLMPHTTPGPLHHYLHTFGKHQHNQRNKEDVDLEELHTTQDTWSLLNWEPDAGLHCSIVTWFAERCAGFSA